MMQATLFLSNIRPISSKQKTSPAIGVLKATAMPAADPARIRPLEEEGELREPAAHVHEAGADVDGRALSADGDSVSNAAVRSIVLPTAIFIDSIRRRSGRSPTWIAAIAWGMPVPSVPGKNLRCTTTIRVIEIVIGIAGSIQVQHPVTAVEIVSSPCRR